MTQLTDNPICRVHTCHGKPGKPGKIFLSWNVMEMLWNFIFLEKLGKCHGILQKCHGKSRFLQIP